MWLRAVSAAADGVTFYSSVVREIGRLPAAGQLCDVVGCLYSSSGICGLVSADAVLAGDAYEPMLFWFGLAGLVRRADPVHGQAERGGVTTGRARKDWEQQCPSS